MITLTFSFFIASFLVFVDCRAADIANKDNSNRVSALLSLIVTITTATILFHYFFIK